MYGSQKITAGQTFKLSNVIAGTAVGVAPGGGGTMLVEYRISQDGPLRQWGAGAVAAATDDVMRMSVAEIVFTATTADGLAEWNIPAAGYNA